MILPANLTDVAAMVTAAMSTVKQTKATPKPKTAVRKPVGATRPRAPQA